MAFQVVAPGGTCARYATDSILALCELKTSEDWRRGKCKLPFKRKQEALDIVSWLFLYSVSVRADGLRALVERGWL